MATKKNGFNTGIASEYLVLSMLYRLIKLLSRLM